MRESLIKRHYEQLAAGRLIAHRCGACNRITFPVRTACAACGGTAWSEVPLSGRGTLHLASHNMAPPPHPRFAALAPYVNGQIELEEGVYTMAVVRGVEPEPDAIRRLYERGPVPVVLDVLRTDDLPVLAFRIVEHGEHGAA